MTDQERVQAFLTGYEVLVKQCGVQWLVELKPRQYGTMIQIEPEITPGLVPNWPPPESEDKAKK